MQKQPNNWGAVASAPYFSEYKFVIAGEEYTKAELQGTPVIEKPLMKTPTIGKCCSGMLQICIRGASIPKAAPVIAYSRIVSKTTGTASDWIEQGHYFVSSRVKKSNCVQFTCRDLMLKANAEYYERSAIEDWPATMADVVNEISTIMGVPLDERTFIRTGEDYVVSCPDADVLMTEVLGDIAAAHMGTWIITECGKLRLVPFTGASVPVSDIGTAHGKISFLSSEYTVTGISLSDEADNTFFAGNKDGYVLSAVCRNAEQKITDDNAELISNGISFLPYSMNDAYISPLTELGDTILVSDKDGNHYPLVVTYMKIVCGMAFVASLSLSVDDTDEDEFPYVDSSMLEKRRTIATGKAYFGNTISRNNGFVSELLIDKQPTARLIANAGKFAMQQFANGEWTDRVYFDPEKGKYHISGEVIIDGTLTIGVLSEKADKTFINGGNIITGTLSASVISSGVLKSKNESLVFDLDNNQLTVGGKDVVSEISRIDTQVMIAADSQLFIKAAGAERFTPESITLRAESRGNIEKYKWFKDGIPLEGAASDSITISETDIAGNSANFSVECEDKLGNQYSAFLTIAKLTSGVQGEDGYTVLISREYVMLNVGVDRKPTKADSITCIVSVYKGVLPLEATNENPEDGQFRVSVKNAVPGITVTQNTPGILVLTVNTDTAIDDSNVLQLEILTDSLVIPKNITIHANMNAVVATHQSVIDTLEDEIVLKVAETDYHAQIPTYSATAPSHSWSTVEEKAANAGYLWYDTNAKNLYKWNGIDTWQLAPEETWAAHSEASMSITASKISWIVKSGTSESNFTMTDRAMALATSALNIVTAPITESVDATVNQRMSETVNQFLQDSDGWWVSQNQNVDSSIALCRVNVCMEMDGVVEFDLYSYGELNWDYAVLGKLDKSLSTTIDDTDENVLRKFESRTVIPEHITLNVPKGNHFFDIKYRKDVSYSTPPDLCKFTTPVCTWEVPGTTLSIRSGETVLSSANVIIRGVVTMTDLLESGSTVINGDNITTGTIRGATLLTEKKLGTLSGYDYYGVTEVTGGGVQFYAEKRSDGSVENTNYVAEFSPNYEDDTYSACLIRLDAKGNNGVAITSPQNCITLQSPEIWLAPYEDGGSANISINAGYGGVYVSATNLRFNTNADPNTGCGTAGQVLKSGGKNDGCYWGDGLLFDLLWSNSTGVYSGEYYYSKDASNYKALLFVGKPSGGSRNSVLVPIEEANGNKFEIGDNSGFINFNVRTNSFTASQRAGGGVLNAVYGIK